MIAGPLLDTVSSSTVQQFHGLPSGLCLDIDPGPNSDPRIGRIARFWGSDGSVDNESASYLPISLRPNPVAPYSLDGGALWGAL